jgi:hypothetical protein
MTSNSKTTQRYVREANIERYRKILKTYLTAEERAFVERRLAEEQEALGELRGDVRPSI